MAYESITKKPLFDGMPALIQDAREWRKNYEKYLTEALKKAAELTTEDLQKAASESKDWAPYSKRLYVQLSKDGDIEFMVDGTPEEIEAIEALEYGSLEQAPAPLIRPQMERLTANFKDRVEILMSQEAIASHA